MYLSQLMVSLRSRKARRDLADRYELHRTLLNAFPETLPDHERVLYRVEESKIEPMVRVLIQSQTYPEWECVVRIENNYLCEEPQIREAIATVQQDHHTRFRLQANPTVKRDGKRHAIYAEDELRKWLHRKGEQHGFSIDDRHIQIIKIGNKYGKKRQQIWHAVQFDGLLSVTNPTEFTQALTHGVGSAKAFGFGLLSIPYPTA